MTKKNPVIRLALKGKPEVTRLIIFVLFLLAFDFYLHGLCPFGLPFLGPFCPYLRFTGAGRFSFFK
jgi:hypothetical protein